ncbi:MULTISPECIES: TadE/TadG family type IV pilus assembly protein [unclassified Candidatus Frackibacter]|uniref:TadE/TadG family type IV pilus assembly protein n=1 Tax=unclassified Candidatus Frackibacter TaxID=2648818 RepID=UPI000880A6C7|nr:MULTISPECIES: TadE/TadG family type IV pilus assembly protein [unclassified Candidatus Frackibacter]SDC72171.1 TadE-like protein [Candidatus Frackibacter sp. WG11]SEM86474.1 TadE-like protein [Candidatus Frackibacter sp. WG12]SFL95513.1 TadE-like protein [Candidatus Frackibacter sp. WG13]
MVIQLLRQKRGQALVELALVLPVILLILFGIVEFGRVFHAYLVITNAAREGAREGAISNSDSQIQSTVETAVDPSLDLNNLNIKISPSQANRSRGDSVKVEVKYNVDLFTPVVTQLLPDPFPISSASVMRIE